MRLQNKKNKSRLNQTIHAIIFAAAVLITAVNIPAATFTVTNTNDSGAGSLRQAIADAGAAAGDDTIAFDASFNTPRTITLASLITVNGNGALTINGSGRDLLTISGNNAVRVFEVTGIASPSIGTITFNNLTIANGFSEFGSNGGGAGIGVNNGASDPPAFTVNLVINNVLFRNNNAGVNPGGAIGGFRSCTLTINNSAFTQNAANGGSAISNGSGIGTCAAVTITNSSFYEHTNGTVSLGGNGNGVYTISGSSFYNNGNPNGSQIVTIQTAATTNTITNTTFFNNRAVGGVMVLSLGTMTMRNVTITGNKANSDNVPGGIQMTNGAILNFGNSILSGNTSPSGENNIEAFGNFVSQGYNIIGNNFSPLTINGTTTGNLLGVNPLLDTTIRNNGGLTPTLNLRPGSPAIDAGNPTTFPATDQRGISRPQDGDGNGNARSDIGAFEKRVIDILPPTFDFDGDRKSDVSVFRPSIGGWYISQSSNNAFSGTTFGQNGDVIAPADFDGDGKTDISVFRQGTWYRLNSSNNSFSAVAFGSVGDVPVPGDFDGDGKADIAVFRPSDNTWYRLSSSNGNFVSTTFGANGDKPQIVDFDGDAKADIAVFRPSNGTWYSLNSSNGSFVVVAFGTAGDLPVPADYDGDAKTDVAVYRGGGVWYRLNSSNGQFVAVSFGNATDKPVPADYDGDAKADVAVFRPSEGTWYLQRSTSGFAAQGFGISTDTPTPNAYVR